MERLRITEIEKWEHHGSSTWVTFSGTLRNQYKFELFEKVYIQHEGKMVECQIRGIELPARDNPDYIYKVQISSDLFKFCNDEVTKTLRCDKIFKSKADAKKSAIRELDNKYKLNRENIERFFT